MKIIINMNIEKGKVCVFTYVGICSDLIFGFEAAGGASQDHDGQTDFPGFARRTRRRGRRRG